MSDFAAGINSAVMDLRNLAEARMQTTVELQYLTDRVTQDPATGAEVPVYELAFESKCRIKSPGLAVSLTQAGGRTVAEVTRQLHIPALSPDPWADERSAQGVTALVTAIHSTDDPSLLGARLTLSGPAPGSQTTARRLEITEVVA